jgi:hypothetical protein
MAKTVTTQTIRDEREPGGDIPEVQANYIAAHPSLFMERQAHEKDVLQFIRMSKRRPTQWAEKPNPELGEPGVETPEWVEFVGDMEALAWLVWRARLVLAWTAVDRKPTMPWSDCVESGWLKDDTFRQCLQRRQDYYDAQEARRDRLKTRMLTGEEAPHTSTSSERKAARKAKAQEKAQEAAISANTQETKAHEAEGPSMQVPAATA